jgi:hypothetical protein
MIMNKIPNSGLDPVDGSGFFGRWIRCQHPFPAASGDDF